jgi:DnaJ-class molecular chaperone
MLEPRMNDRTCAHRLADARNAAIQSGYVCVDCHAVFAAADHGVTACPKCGGSGWKPNRDANGETIWTPLMNDALPCECGALARKIAAQKAASGVTVDAPTRWCPECRSAGVVGIEQDVCPTCDGTGRVAAPGVDLPDGAQQK